MSTLYSFPSIILSPIMRNKIKNDVTLWVVLAFILVLVIAAYAFYCTSKGWNFGWTVKLSYPKSFNPSIKCTK